MVTIKVLEPGVLNSTRPEFTGSGTAEWEGLVGL